MAYQCLSFQRKYVRLLACLHYMSIKEVAFSKGRFFPSQSERFKKLWLAGKSQPCIQKATLFVDM